MGASITFAGESLIAQKQGAREALAIARFVLANVPGLDAGQPVDRQSAMPSAEQIVFDGSVTKEAYLSPNQVVYSLSLGSDVGDWDFNWIGLVSTEDVLFAVAYVPLQQKRREIPPLQTGNNLTRNFLVVFDGAQELTGVTIPAETWQYDLSGQLAGKLDTALLAGGTTGDVAVGTGNDAQPIDWVPRGAIAAAAIPMAAPFLAEAGARYCLLSNAATATLPPTAGLAPGDAVAFVKVAAATQPLVTVEGTASETITFNGITDTGFYLDINAEVIVVWNGAGWEV